MWNCVLISPKNLRVWHRYFSMIFLLPLLLIAVTGFLLSIRSYTPWIQAPAVKATPGWPSVNLETLWVKAQNISDADLKTFNNLKSIEIRPKSGTIHFRAQNGYEIQFDGQTGEILSSAKRWTPFLVKIHEGTFLPNLLKNIIFIPAGLVLIFLSMTGLYIFLKSLKAKKGST